MPARLPLSRINTGQQEDFDHGDAPPPTPPPPTPPPKDPQYKPNPRGALRVAITHMPSGSSLSCVTSQRSLSATRPPLSRYASQQEESDSEHSPSSSGGDRSLHPSQPSPGSASLQRVRPALEPGTPADPPSNLSSPRPSAPRPHGDDRIGSQRREHRSFTARRSKRRAKSPPQKLMSPINAEPSTEVAALFSAAIAAANGHQRTASTPASPFLDSWASPTARRGRSQDGRPRSRPPTREAEEPTAESMRRSNSASARSAPTGEEREPLWTSKSLPTEPTSQPNAFHVDHRADNDGHPIVETLVETLVDPAVATTLSATLDTPFESPADWMGDDRDEDAGLVTPPSGETDVSAALPNGELSHTITPPSPLIAASQVHGVDTTPVPQSTEAPAKAVADGEDSPGSMVYESDDSSTRSSLRSSLFLCLEGGKSTRSSSLTVGDDVKDQAAESAQDGSSVDFTSVTAVDSSSETAPNVSNDDLTALPTVLRQQASREVVNEKGPNSHVVPPTIAIQPANAGRYRHHDQASIRSRDYAHDPAATPWCAPYDVGFTSTTVTATHTPSSKSRFGNFFRKSSRSGTSPSPARAPRAPDAGVRHVSVQQHAHSYAKSASPATPFDHAPSGYSVNISADATPSKSARKSHKLRAPFGSDLKAWDEKEFRQWVGEDTAFVAAARQTRSQSAAVPPTRKLSISAGSHLTNGPPPAPSALANLNQGAAAAAREGGASPMQPPPESPAPSAMSHRTSGSGSSGSGGLGGLLRRTGSALDKRPQHQGRSMSVSSGSTTTTTTHAPSRIKTSGNSVGRMAGVGESRGRHAPRTAEFAMAAAMIR